ncbi:MAG: hypothetical protein M3O70_23180 [Actinomycetota bacterium]|nr:hypothetical protein [Actinomycetota bacterium]
MGDREHVATINRRAGRRIAGHKSPVGLPRRRHRTPPMIVIGRRILVPMAMLHRMLGLDLMHDPSPDVSTGEGGADQSGSGYASSRTRTSQTGTQDQ